MAKRQESNIENTPNEMTGEGPDLQEEKGAKGKTKKHEKPNLENKILDAELLVAAAEEKLCAAEVKVSELNDRLLRTTAEYDNHRKRSQKEHESAFSNGVGYAVNELLIILDTLDAAANAETSDPEYKKGVMLTLAKCEEIFTKLGIKEIEAMGQPFDPELHNAVMQQPAEGVESGTITNVILKGYILGEKVIRHAMVAVAP